jgi:hypothetical protein
MAVLRKGVCVCCGCLFLPFYAWRLESINSQKFQLACLVYNYCLVTVWHQHKSTRLSEL